MASLLASPKAQATFTQSEIDEYRQHFSSFDANGDHFIDDKELAGVMKNLGLYESQAQVQKLMKEVGRADELQSGQGDGTPDGGGGPLADSFILFPSSPPPL